MGLRRYDALALTAGIWFLGKFLRFAFPPLFGTLQDTFGVSTTVTGSAFGALMIAYASMQFPSGLLSDRLGPVRVITAGAVVAAAGALSIVVPGSLALLVGGMVLVGLGSGAHKTVAVPMLSAIYDRRPGRALGVLDTFGAFGGVVAPPLVVFMLDAPGWRFVFLLGGAVALALAVGFYLVAPARIDGEPGDDGAGSGGTGSAGPGGTGSDRGGGDGDATAAYRALLGDRRLAVVLVAMVLTGFALNGAVAFLPLYLTEAAGLSTAFAGTVYSGYFLVSLVQLGTGEIADRIGMVTVLAGTVALGAAGLAGVLVVETPPAVAATVVLFGVGVHGHRPVRGAYFAALLPDAGEGGAFGVIRTALIAAAAAAPVVTGYLSDVVGFRPAFLALVGALVAAVVLIGGVLVGDRVGGAAA